MLRFTQEWVEFDIPGRGNSAQTIAAVAPSVTATSSQQGFTALEKPASSAANRFVYMREFRRRYEEYCLEQGLDPVTARDEIVRNLVDWYNTKVNTETVSRMKG